jgi:transcription antitermination factor NusG
MRLDQIKNIPQETTTSVDTVTEARLNLKKLGEPVDSRMEAIRRFSAGDRIFAFHEQDDDPIEIQKLDELENFTPDQLLAVSRAAVAEASDISGLMHAARHYNRSFIVTARTAEGSTRRYRVRAQSERTAREQFSRHHNQAEILDVREEKLAEAQGAEGLNIGDEVIVTGAVQFQGSTGVIEQFGRDKRFVVVNLYNQGRHSFHSSDVSFNEYADSDAEEARMYDSDPEFRKHSGESELKEGRRLKTVVRGDNPDVYAKVYLDTDWDEFQVRLFVNGKYAGEDSDYHASDLDDAMSTAQDMVRRADPGINENTDQLKKRITARKYQGDDQASWAVFIDGRPMVTGLYKREVPYQKEQALRILQKKGVTEGKSLLKRVRVVQGPHKGKLGMIRQIKHGMFKGAPKVYFIDLDDGEQADNLPATALRLVRDEQDVAEAAQAAETADIKGYSNKYTARETRDGVWRVFKDSESVAVAGPFQSAEQASAWISQQKKVAESL